MALLATLVQLSGLLGFTWWLLGQYKDPHVTPTVHCAVFLSWSLGFLGLLLLPMDLVQNGFPATASSASTGPSATMSSSTASSLTESARASYLYAWQVLYWLTFVLSWLVLPFLVEFCQNGEFLLEQRILSSLRRLVFHWTILAAVVGVVVVYLVFVDHFSLYGLIGLAMASSNTYGLLWLISLLGYGLADIPRSFWTLRFPESRLQELHFRAVQVYDERMEAIFQYEDVVGAVHDCYERMLHAEGVAIILTSDMQFVKTCVLQVKDLVGHDGNDSSKPDSSNSSASSWSNYERDRSTSRRTTVAGSPFTSSSRAPALSEVVDLHHRARLAMADRRRSEQTWLELCIQTENLQDRALKRELPPASLFPATSMINEVRNLCISAQHHAHRVTMAPVSICCAVITGFASFCILWGELTMGISGSSASLFRTFSHKWGPNASELVAFLVLLYMVVCSYSSLFKLRVFGRFALRQHHNSTDLSLLKTSIHQCRLQFAIGYNFLLLLNDRKLTDRAALAKLFENMKIVHVLGRDFSVYAPLLMVLLVAFTLSNGYAHVMKRLGLDQYEQVILGNADHAAQIAKGEALVQQGLERYRTIIRRQRRSGGASSYGFAKTNAGAQALLDGDDGGGDEERMENSGSISSRDIVGSQQRSSGRP